MSESVLKNNCQYKKTTNSSKLCQCTLMNVAWQPIHPICLETVERFCAVQEHLFSPKSF